MRGDEQALDLLVGVVGQREHDPGRMGAASRGAHLDAPDDAVGPGAVETWMRSPWLE